MCHAAQLAQDVEALEQYEKLWVDALKAAVKNNAKMQSNAKENTDTESSGGKYSLNKNFSDKYDAWDKKRTGFAFYIGNTSDTLIRMGISNKKIYWDASKILKIKEKHPAMTDLIIKQVPNIIENPIIIMESKTIKGRLTLFGQVYDENNSPVLAVLELNSTKNGNEISVIKIASAYGKNSNPQKLLNESKILYVESNKKVADAWLSLNRLQLPLGVKYGYNTTISQNDTDVNSSIREKGGNNTKFSLSETDSYVENINDIYGYKIKQGIKVNEDLLELLSIYDKNAKVDTNGNVTVYHRTNADAAEKIRKTGIMTAKEDALFFSSEDNGYAIDYGDTVITLKIPSTVLEVNDVFDGEVHFDLPLRYKNGVYSLNVSQYLKDTDTKFSISENDSNGNKLSKTPVINNLDGIMSEFNGNGYFAFRGVSEHDIEVANRGYLDRSLDLWDSRGISYDDETELLNGTSGISINSYKVNPEAVKKLAKKYLKDYNITLIKRKNQPS